MKFLDLLKEIATSSYTLSSAKESRETSRDVYVDYNFETDSKREYYVRFSSKWVGREKQPDQKYNWATELTFFPVALSSKDTEVGGENFPKILGTVIEALKKYISEYKPEYVYWKGIISNKEEKPSSEESNKRQRIYNLLMDRGTSGISGYTPIKGNKWLGYGANRLSGLLYDGEIPVENADKIFKYPEEPTLRDEEEIKKRVSRFNLSRG